jgi:NTP pyrophosphatase (non-canonical NTP hydrolase)
MLTRDELLVLLIEECGEVVQAATKCLRFGYDRDQPDYGINSEVLAKEVGDLMGVVEALPLRGDLIEMFRQMKVAKATRIRDKIANEAAPQPLAAYR